MGAAGVGQGQDQGLGGLTIFTRAYSGLWVWAGHPGRGWGVAAFQGLLLAACPARRAGWAPSSA